MEDPNDEDIVSSRGLRALKPPLPYLGSFFEALQDPCDVKSNPHGRIALCVAENKLILKKLSTRLCTNSVAVSAFNNHDNYCYNDMRGLMHARESVARFLTKKFLKPEHHENGKPNENSDVNAIEAKNVILGSGCAGLLNGLSLCLAEAKDAVLIPSPYYAAFESDVSVVAECVTLKVLMKDPTTGPTPGELEIAYNQAATKNLRVKILLLTNPNNPLGTIYSADTIKKSIDWARGKKIHTIVDEIYALSVHDSHDQSFQSVTKILNNHLGNDVHFLWALSKDFGSSGFRVGVLYTQNQVLNDALGNLNIFSSVSHPMQAVVASLLDDDEFIDEFLETSRTLLKISKSIVTNALDGMDIPYINAQAGIFLYCDFSSLLPEDSFDGEAKLASLIQNEARVVMTPGESQRDKKPGQFRICYAWVTPEVLQFAMGRLKLLTSDIRGNGWENLQSKTYYKF
jgi:aspartate/methionine/tyrosine aminotransferase